MVLLLASGCFSADDPSAGKKLEIHVPAIGIFKEKLIPELDKVFAGAQPSKTTEFDLCFFYPQKYSDDFTNCLYPLDYAVDRGSITFWTADGKLTIKAGWKEAVSAPTPKFPQQVLTLDRKDLSISMFGHIETNGVSTTPLGQLSLAADSDDVHLKGGQKASYKYFDPSLPVRWSNGSWRIHVKFTTSADYQGKFSKWVIQPGIDI